MKYKTLLALPIVALLSGCAAQLKPGDDVSKYFIIPGTTFVPTLLCGIDSGTEACLRMQNGSNVKTVINTDFSSWVLSLAKNQQLVTQSGKTGLILDLKTGNALLKALIEDNKKREQIRRQRIDDKDRN